MTKFLNISTDTALGGNSPSDQVVSSQKAIKEYVDQNGPNVDNLSITRNGSNKLQAIGVIDQNDSTKAIKFWRGTAAQYAQITPDPGTVYIITDDDPMSILSTISGYDATKVQILKNVQGTFMWVEGGTID